MESSNNEPKKIEIQQIYIASFENVIGKPVIENNVITAGIEVADKKKFMPAIWSSIDYAKIPDELLITDNLEYLFIFLINFKQKFLFVNNTDSLPVVNFEEVYEDYKDMTESHNWKRYFPSHKYKYSILIKRVGRGWKFQNVKFKGGILVEEFIKSYVSFLQPSHLQQPV